MEWDVRYAHEYESVYHCEACSQVDIECKFHHKRQLSQQAKTSSQK